MYWTRIDAVFKCQRTAEKGFGPKAAIKPFLVLFAPPFFIGSPAKQALHKTIVFAAILSRNPLSTSCRRKVLGTTFRASNLILFLSILTALKRLYT